MQTINCSEYTQNNPHQWAHMSLRPLKSRWIVQKAFRWNVLVLFDTQAVISFFCISSAPFVKPKGHKRSCAHACQWKKFIQDANMAFTNLLGLSQEPTIYNQPAAKRQVAFYCHFCFCAWNIFNWSQDMGVYGLAWTPAFIFDTIWTPGPNFGSKGPLVLN